MNTSHLGRGSRVIGVKFLTVRSFSVLTWWHSYLFLSFWHPRNRWVCGHSFSFISFHLLCPIDIRVRFEGQVTIGVAISSWARSSRRGTVITGAPSGAKLRQVAQSGVRSRARLALRRLWRKIAFVWAGVLLRNSWVCDTGERISAGHAARKFCDNRSVIYLFVDWFRYLSRPPVVGIVREVEHKIEHIAPMRKGERK